MAKFLSQVYTTIRGSVGGITYTANQFQPLIARARVAPVNPNTSYQSMVRSAFAGAAQMWRNLTDTVREGWNDYAKTCIYEGPMGTYTIPGRQMFIGNIGNALYQQARGNIVGAVAGTAPVIPGFFDVTQVADATYVGPGTGIAFTMTYMSAESWIGYGSRSFAFDPSRYRFKGPFLSAKLDFVLSPGAGSIIVEFDFLVAGMIYFSNPRALTAGDPFRMSPSYYLRHTAVTVP